MSEEWIPVARRFIEVPPDMVIEIRRHKKDGILSGSYIRDIESIRDAIIAAHNADAALREYAAKLADCPHEVTTRLKQLGEYGASELTDWLWCCGCGATKVHDSEVGWTQPGNIVGLRHALRSHAPGEAP